MVVDINNFFLQLDYKTPFNQEEQAYYEHLCQGLDRQLAQTVEWLQSSQAEEFYRERAEYLEGLWQQYDLDNQLDNVINYNASSCDEFMDNFYHAGAMIGYQQLKRGLAYTPADEKTLNFIRQTNYGFVKNLNNDVKNGIRRTIFEDIAKGNSYQKTINKLRKLPLEPVANGKLSPDVRARFIARTERARARGYGTIQSYLNYGVQAYDLITGKGACNICIDLEENNPYPIQDSKAYVPIHPNCRCSNAPYIDDEYPLSDTPLDYPLSVSDYVDATMKNVTERPQIQLPIKPATTEYKPTEHTIEDYDGERITQHVVDVYDMGDYTISIEKGNQLSFKDVKNHIDSLPSKLTNDMTLKDIKVLNKRPSGVAGDYSITTQKITVYTQPESKNMLNTLTHELSHAKDFKFNARGIIENTLSRPDNWEKIWKADNKANAYTRSNGKKRTPKIFPTNYAGNSWLKFKKGKTDVEKVRRFQEDFAESHKLYFNTDSKVREEFIQRCPNRAKYLEGLYG